MKFTFAMPHMLRLKASVQAWEAAVTGPDQLRLAKRAEELGFDQISVPEHMIIPQEHVDLSGPHYFHGIAAMGAFAGATETIRINSCILILPLQNPIVTAKGLSTVDWMSGGRVTATFGVGWLRREFDLLGVPFAERGRIADEYLEAMIELWTKEEPEFEGRYVSFSDVAFEPKPVGGALRIWMGGDADPVLRRTARFATGWWPFLTKPHEIGDRIDYIKSQPDYAGGDDFEVMYGLATSRVGEGHAVVDDPAARSDMSAQEIVDRIGRFAEQGVTMTGVPIPPVSGIEAYLDHAQWIMEEIRPQVS